MLTDNDSTLLKGPSIDEREERLRSGANDLAKSRSLGGMQRQDRVLLTAAGTAMAFGILAILLGWVGASRSTHTEEQVPYLISGGLLGVALATIGSATFFGLWMTMSMREAREHEAARARDHLQLMEALRNAQAPEPTILDGTEKADAGSRSKRTQRPLRGVARGS